MVHGSKSTIMLSKMNPSANVADTGEQGNLMLKIENRQNL